MATESQKKTVLRSAKNEIKEESKKPEQSSTTVTTSNSSFSDIFEIVREYKNFCFKIVNFIPYSSVATWIKFADGKCEEVLDEESKKGRGIIKNIIDMWMLTFLSFIFSLIGGWPFLLVFVFYGGILTAFFSVLFGGLLKTIIGGTGVVFTLASGVVGFILIFITIILLVLILTAVGLLFETTIYYLFSKILGGNGSFKDTMSVLLSSTASMFIFLIPIHLIRAVLIGYCLGPLVEAVSLLIFLVMLYYRYRGIKHIHNLSQNRAIISTVGSIAILFLTAIMVVVLFYFLYISIFIFGGVGVNMLRLLSS
ncbi:MAG: hypothetical protein QXF35_00340 [Candidatus Bilamarchaeaceae archaeon]